MEFAQFKREHAQIIHDVSIRLNMWKIIWVEWDAENTPHVAGDLFRNQKIEKAYVLVCWNGHESFTLKRQLFWVEAIKELECRQKQRYLFTGKTT